MRMELETFMLRECDNQGPQLLDCEICYISSQGQWQTCLFLGDMGSLTKPF